MVVGWNKQTKKDQKTSSSLEWTVVHIQHTAGQSSSLIRQKETMQGSDFTDDSSVSKKQNFSWEKLLGHCP